MKKKLMTAFILFFAYVAFAGTEQQLATGRDILVKDSSSLITLNHNTGGTISSTGIYIQALCYNSGCTTTTNGYQNKNGLAFGAIYSGVTFLNNDSVTIGSNFLYNMIYHALYQANQTSGSIGSTYTPGQAGSSGNAWYIKLGVITSTPGPLSNTIGSEALSYGSATSISITCDDAAFTCTAGSSSTQSF